MVRIENPKAAECSAAEIESRETVSIVEDMFMGLVKASLDENAAGTKWVPATSPLKILENEMSPCAGDVGHLPLKRYQRCDECRIRKIYAQMRSTVPSQVSTAFLWECSLYQCFVTVFARV